MAAYYGVNDRVRVRIAEEPEEGVLVDIDMVAREFKVKIGTASYWISQSQIIEKIEDENKSTMGHVRCICGRIRELGVPCEDPDCPESL